MSSIRNVTVVGGTHGNEFSGIYLVKKWRKRPELISRPDFETSTLFAHPKAFEAHMAEAVVLFEDHISLEEQGLLCSISDRCALIEVGPQPQSVLRQDIMDQMEAMTGHVLDYLQHVNAGTLPTLSDYEAFRYRETLSLPEDDAGERAGVVHERVQDADFQPLRHGDPIFTLFTGEVVTWKGHYEAYPHFINEAAYYDNNLAMSLAEKVTIAPPKD